MAIKTLQTRIALKYDSYENWLKTDVEGQGANLVLLPGEIGLCEIPGSVKTFVENGKNVTVETAPTVLFKVGNAEGKSFKDLPWASAKAADVYSWAKASEVKRDGKKLVFVGGKEDGSNLEVEFDYYTEADVKAITDPIVADVSELEGRIADVEAALGVDSGSEGSVSARLTAVEGALEVLNDVDTVEGSVAHAVKGAKDYTDEREVEINKAIATAKSGAEETAKGYTDGEVSKLQAKDAELVAEDERLAGLIGDMDTAYKAAVKEVSDKVDVDKVSTAIADAKSGAESTAKGYTDEQVAALKNGDVKTNTDNIAKNTADIADLTAALAQEVKDRGDKDTNLEGRLAEVEAFFTTKDAEGNDVELSDALDTLYEIQKYITEDGTAAGAMIERIGANEEAIGNLNKEFAAGGRVTVVESEVAELEGRVEDVEAIVDGYGAEGDTYATVKAHVEAVSVRAEKGITDAEAVRTYVDGDFKTAVESYADGKATTAETNAKGYADEKVAGLKGTYEAKVAELEGEDERLAGLIGGNTTEINTLKNTTIPGVVSDYQAADKAINDKIGTKGDAATVDTVYGAIADAKKAGTDAASAASVNAGKIAAIEEREEHYLVDTDVYIFDCGSSTLVVHTKG